MQKCSLKENECKVTTQYEYATLPNCLMNRKADFGAISAALFVVAVQYSRNFENSLK